MPRPTISAFVLTKNEEHNIRECLESLKWVDEIVVVDSGSIDRTVEIAKEFTDKVIFHKWEGFRGQRTFALQTVTGDWVICLDADERVTPQLRDEILRELSREEIPCDGFEVRRKAYYLGRWIKHSGWYPDYLLRVFRKDRVRNEGVDPHDYFVVDGGTKRLSGEILHYSYRSISEHLRAIDSLTTISAEQKLRSGVRFPLLRMLLHPPAKFFRTFFLKLGFLDGVQGFIISVLGSYYVFLKYAKLYELKRQKSKEAWEGYASLSRNRHRYRGS